MLDIKSEPMDISDITEKLNPNDYMSIFRKIEKLSMQKIEFSKPLVTFCGNPLLYPQSILTIQGQKGSHKSRFLETIFSCFLNKNEENVCDMEIQSELDFMLILLDTERSISESLPSAIQRIKQRAGYAISQPIENFIFISNIQTEMAERLELFKNFIGELRQQFPNKHFIIAVDVVTDLMATHFNETGDSMQLVHYLNLLVNDYNSSVIAVIHENPQSQKNIATKARGHAGTEIVNKSSSVISIRYDKKTDLVTADFLHLRNHKIPEKVVMQYCDEVQGLEVIPNENLEDLHQEQTKLFTNNLYDELVIRDKTQTELQTQLCKTCNISKNTALAKLKELVDCNLNGKFLRTYKVGRVLNYSLRNEDEKVF